MAKNEEFLKALQSVYGNNKLSRKSMRQLKRTWKENPNYILNAAKQKDELRAKEAERQAYQQESKKWETMPKTSLGMSASVPSKIDYKGPSQMDLINQRLDSGDMSMFSDFGTAFREARKRGQSEFNWRETEANPSGRFNTQLRPDLPPDNTDDNIEVSPTRVPIDKSKINTPSWEQDLFDPVPYPWADQVSREIHPMEKPLQFKSSAQQIRESMPAVNTEGSLFSTFGTPAQMSDGSFRNTSRVMQMGSDGKFNELGRQRWMWSDKNQYGEKVSNPRWEPMDTKVSVRYQQQGGTMGANDQELQKAFMAFLIEDAAAQGMQIQSEQDLQAYAQQLGEEGLKAKYQEFMQKMQGGVKAKLGAKLNYLHKIKGNCPDGYEMIYMKEGGRVCPVCQKKAEKAKDGKKLPKQNAVSKFKEDRKRINPNDTVNTKFGPRDLNGNTKYKKYDASKENYDFETRKRVQEKDEKSGKKVIGSACGSKMKKK